FGCAAAPAAGPCPGGVYKLEVYASLAGAKDIAVTFTPAAGAAFDVTAQPGGGASVQAVFVAPPLDPASSVFVLGDPVDYPGESQRQDDWDDPKDDPDGGDSVGQPLGEAFHANVRTWDKGRNNPIGGVAVNYQLSPAAPGAACPGRFAEGGGATLTKTTSALGKASAAVVADTPGSCVITATIGAGAGAAAVPGSPKRLTWVLPPLDDAASSFEVSASPVVADGKATGSITVTLVDVAGQPVEAAAGALAATAPAASGLVFSAFSHQGGGVYSAAFSGAKAGSSPVQVTLQGAAIRLRAGANGFANLVAPTGTAPADGAHQLIVQAELADANGNPAAGAAAVFAVPAGTTAVDPASGKAVAVGPAEWTAPADAAGLASLALVSATKGGYEVTAKTGGDAIVQGSPVTAVFSNAALSAARSSFEIPDAAVAKQVRTEYHTPTVTLVDASGNPYTDAPVDVVFRWRERGASAWAGTKTVASTAGKAVWADWTVERAGTYEVQASVPSGVVGSTLAAVFKAGPAVPAASQFTSSSGADVPNNGQAAHFAQVLVLDAASGGNPVAGEPVEFAVNGQARIEGAAGGGQSETVASSAQGLARVEIVDSAPGGETVTVTAKVGGQTVGSASLKFAQTAPDPAKSSWSVAPTRPLGPGHPVVLADGADSWTARVEVRDATGRPVPDAEVVFALPAGVATAVPGPHKTDAQGNLEVALTATTVGAHQVRALLGAEGLDPDPAQISFGAGPVDGAVSRLQGPAHAAVADGRTALTVSALIEDPRANPIPKAEVRFNLPPGVDAVGGTPGAASVEVVAGADGTASVDLVSTRAGTHAVTADARAPGISDWTAVTQGSPAQVEFTAGPADAAGSDVSASPAAPLTVGSAT
ncbi:MAG: Ig-like domain-containing protein, partial [Bifidobacteriaceae bacterium]|nr:Ig-like domain-containing protein [Bifidobacteriaceae bacterium]